MLMLFGPLALPSAASSKKVFRGWPFGLGRDLRLPSRVNNLCFVCFMFDIVADFPAIFRSPFGTRSAFVDLFFGNTLISLTTCTPSFVTKLVDALGRNPSTVSLLLETPTRVFFVFFVCRFSWCV